MKDGNLSQFDPTDSVVQLRDADKSSAAQPPIQGLDSFGIGVNHETIF